MAKQIGLAHDTAPSIDEVLSIWAGSEKRPWRTRLEIADALGRSKSPALLAIIEVGVGLGLLQRKSVELPNKVGMFMYRPTDKAYAELSIL